MREGESQPLIPDTGGEPERRGELRLKIVTGIFLAFLILLVSVFWGSALPIHRYFEKHTWQEGILYDQDSASFRLVSNKDIFKYLRSTPDYDTSGFLAYGSFYPSQDGQNYGYLTITANSAKSPLTEDAEDKAGLQILDKSLAMEAAGFLEGHITCKEIRQMYRNYYEAQWGKAKRLEDSTAGILSPYTLDFLMDNWNYMAESAYAALNAAEEEEEEDGTSRAHWASILGVQRQLLGLLGGYRAGCLNSKDAVPVKPGLALEDFLISPDARAAMKTAPLSSIHDDISLLQLLLLNANGDMFEISKLASLHAPVSPPKQDIKQQKKQGEVQQESPQSLERSSEPNLESDSSPQTVSLAFTSLDEENMPPHAAEKILGASRRSGHCRYETKTKTTPPKPTVAIIGFPPLSHFPLPFRLPILALTYFVN